MGDLIVTKDAEVLTPQNRVLIRTLPLARGNYGCILQAYALQRAVIRLGVDATTDRSERVGISTAMRRLVSALASTAISRPVGYRERMRVANRAIWEFIDREIATDAIFRLDFVPSRRRLNRYQALLVGSDQVWRPEYGDIESYLFDFAPPSVPRLSYAASFGTDSPSLDRRSRELAQQFTAISVREETGVEVVRDNWGLSAERVPDPTMLLHAEEYSTLIGVDEGEFSAKTALVYVLDATSSTQAAVAAAAHSLGLHVHDLARPLPRSAGQFRKRRAEFIRPSVAHWLRGFRDAELVVTDSFHGTLFSIMFNTPFVTVANSKRGLTRFESLLSRFGLADRLVSPGASGDASAAVRAVLDLSIDWDRVNSKIADERDAGIAFLSGALVAAGLKDV